jgi:PAS domain S-box-containing protein
VKPFFSSVVARLIVWVLLLSILPMGVMAIFVRRNVLNSFERVAISAQFEQARANVAYFPDVDDPRHPISTHMQHSQPALGEHFVVDGRGIVLFHPNPAHIGASLAELYSPESVQKILASDSGGFVDKRSGYVLGFYRFPGKDWVDIVAIESATLSSEIALLTRMSAIQLGISLVVVALCGGVVIWFLVGSPLLRLTHAARALGSGSLDVAVDPSRMSGELSILAETMNKTRQEMRALVAGLEQQVSELNLASRSLRESQTRFRTIFNSINDSVLVLDAATFSILAVNNRFSEMYGYQEDELPSLTMEDLISDSADYASEDFRNRILAVKRGGPQIFDWHTRHKDGSFFWVEISMRVAQLGEDSPALVIVVRDIDRRKRSQQVQVANYRIVHLAQSKPTLYEFFTAVHQVLQTFVPAPNFFVALTRPSDQTIYYPYHLDQHEISPFAQQEIDNFLLGKLDQNQGLLLVDSENLPAYLQNGFSEAGFSVPFRRWLGLSLNTAHGSLGTLVMKYYESEPYPGSVDLENLSLFAVQVAAALERKLAEDALRESEARWRTLMQSSSQLILTINRAGKILFVNQTLPDRISQLNEDEILLYFLPGDSEQEKKNMLERVFGERASLAFEFSLPHDDAETAWFSANLAPVIDRGNVEFAILNAMDISTRKIAEDQVRGLNGQLEERVSQRTAMLEAANRELESFSYSISHDLRAPLRAINGFSRILEDEIEKGSPETRTRYLSLIRENAQQMGMLIDDLLAFSRLGRQAINPGTVPTREVLRQVLNSLDQEIQDRNILIVLPEDLPDCPGDAALLKQVWVNLVSNAIKFTRRQPNPKIEIGFAYGEGEVIYHVRDNGIGFDMKYADKLFGVFQRLHRAEDFEGTGVGLAIVHRLIDRHGGRVWVDASPGLGCTLFFSLPFRQEGQ